MIIWHNDDSAEVVKEDAKPFIVTSNMVDALLYTEYMGPMTFYNRDEEGCRTSYAITQGLPKQEADFSTPIFTFARDFGYYSYGD